jgi:hypothetical protein
MIKHGLPSAAKPQPKGFNRQDAKTPRNIIIPELSSWRLGVLAVQNLVGKTRLFRSVVQMGTDF